MNATTPLSEFARKIGAALILGALAANSHGGPTDLATEPFTSGGALRALPNVMFVLDDSGSMAGDFLPDWAAYLNADTTVRNPYYRFYNNAFNGVAYNPATYYRPPVMYTNTGALDTTTYPSMNGQSVASGGDATATAGSPNWRAVKVDGYGIQSVATVNLEGNAYSYTTVPGEYCTDVKLRTCTASTTPTGIYTFPAKLRWCDSAANALAATSVAGTRCQAANIADTGTYATNGVIPYPFARMPSPRTATITVTGTGTPVNSILVDSAQILSANAGGGTTADVAQAITAFINACTLGLSGNCTVVGYSATSVGAVVTVTAPGATTSTPARTGGSTTATAFAAAPSPNMATITVTGTGAITGIIGASSKQILPAATANSATTATPGRTGGTTSATAFSGTPRQASITVTGTGSVTDITVDTLKILSAATGVGASTAAVATAIAANINACTLVRSGNCTVVGYSATSALNVVTITAPSDTSAVAREIAAGINRCTIAAVGNCTVLGYSASSNGNVVTVVAPAGTAAFTPAVSGGATTATPSGTGSVPGASLFTVITPSVTSYPFPGTLTKHTNRTDCAGTTCTHAEEMTNYANWYAYYRTRMQMMKTSASIAFSSVDDQFRVGYHSINNATGSDFLNLSAFDGAQKNLWYAKFLNARPYGETPLRTALADVGRLYAGKLSTLNGVTANDPMQYSCQQNFTILSTDGYWTATANPKQIDGTTDIGEQDHNDPRPFYDGGTQILTTSTTWWNDEQFAANTHLFQKRTRQQQTSTRRLDQSVTTTTTYPKKIDTTPLRQRTATLNKTEHWLRQTQYDIVSSPTVLTQYTTKYISTPYPLNSFNTQLTQTKQQLDITTERLVKKTSTVLQAKVYKITLQESVLKRSTFWLTKVTSQLQRRAYVSINGGDSYNWTVWANAATCTVRPAGSTPVSSGSAPNIILTKDVECQYVTASTTPTLAVCDVIAASSAPNYTVQNPVSCTYEAALVTTATGSNSDAVAKTTSGTHYVKAITYAYDSPSAAVTGQASCATQSQSTGNPWVGPARTCAWDTAVFSTTDMNSTCTDSPAGGAMPVGGYTGSKTACGYTGTATDTINQETCTVSLSAASPYSVYPKVSCSYESNIPKTNVATCTDHGTDSGTASGSVWSARRVCALGASSTTGTNLNSCTFSGGQSGINWTPKYTCSYQAASSTGTGVGSCTQGTPGTVTTTGTIWSNYASCAWGAAGGATSNLSSCSTSGGPLVISAGTTATGPRVDCSSMTPVPLVVASCAPSGVLYASPLITCGYVASGATTTNPPGGCTPSAPTSPYVAAGINCAYTGGSVTSNVAACDIVAKNTVAPYYGPAYDCAYVTQAAAVSEPTCNIVAKSAAPATHWVGPARDCAYTGFGSWSAATLPCTDLAKNTSGTTYNGPAKECLYNGTTVTTYAGTCTPAGDSPPTYNVASRVVCTNGSFPFDTGPATAIVDTCSTAMNGIPVGSPVTVTTLTSCIPRAAVTVNTVGCSPIAADTPPAYRTTVTCPIADTTFQPVAPGTCVETGTPESPGPLTFDGTGKIVECRTTDTTVYNATFPAAVLPAVNPVAVPSCAWTVNPTVTDNAVTGVRTTCWKPAASVAFPTLNLAPVPADPATCNPTSTPVAPLYIWTRCNPVTTTATVRGCSAVAPTSPLWETKTCADDGTGTRNTLADVAAYYYKTDLRTPALGNCSGAVIPATGLQGVLCSATNAMNNVPTTTGDPLSTQHMTTFTLGLGASGYMQYSSTYPTDTSGDFSTVKGVDPWLPDNGIAADPANGICAWQSTDLCNWPIPVVAEQTTIDDLWHAGVNGRGAYFSATDPTSLSTSIAAALAGVAAKGGSGASPTASNASIKQGDNYFFNSNYTTLEWTGELVRKQINPITAEASTATDWSAQAKLDNKVWTTRAIWTFDNSVATTKLKAFNSTNFAANSYFLSPHISTAPNGLTQYLCASASICLSVTDQDAAHAAGANLVKYLMGDRSNEGAETNNTKYYRQRTHVLGDLVNAQVVYVNKPQYNYADPGYTAYIAAQANRIATLYAGANDGMLHAFRAKGSTATELLVEAAATAVNAAVLDQSNAALATAAATAVAASTAAVAADTLIGQEIWAYIPTMVFPHLYKLADKKYKDKHRYFVDGSPVSGDICTTDCTLGTAVWKTILVGGLGRGGRGYYALDITDPASPKALWEFTDANLGYTFGTPQIAKLADGTWVVLVPSGYNNIANEDGAGGDGVGRLFVLDAVTGTLIRSISTGVGDTTTPSGLAKITAQVISPDSDNTIEAVYGGDLLGNLWRFDVNNNLGATGFDAQLLAALKDGSGNPQPITTKPQVTSIPTTGEKMVIVGTGSYLALSDATDTNTQSVYAMKDSRVTGGTAATAIFDNPGGSPRVTGTSTAGFVRQIFTEETCPVGTSTNICAVGELVRTATANPVNFATDNGWFFDLITLSERANTDPAIGLGALVINTNVPSVEACEVGGSSYQYDLNYLTGSAIGATSTSPLSKRVVGKQLANQLASSPILLMTASGKLVALSGLAGGGISIKLPALPPGASISRRTSWRELIRE